MRASRQKNGLMKNATARLLAVALLFLWGTHASVIGVSAAEQDPSARLYEGLMACEAAIDLGDASLPTAGLGGLYLELLHTHPELFHVALRLTYGYIEVAGVRTVTEVYPVYTLSGRELAEARVLYENSVQAILSDMDSAFGNRPPTEAEAVLYLHDYLAHRYAYDTRPEAEANADAYRFFRDGKGICQAYALAFLALCGEAGITAHLVVSDAMDHAWNHVQVDGAWYHVDVTRDDPIPNATGEEEVNHHRLLRSDGGMVSLGYHGFSCSADHTCADTRFEATEGGVLGGYSTALIPRGDGWLGVDASGGVTGVFFTDGGASVSQPGDANGDGTLDPLDLLAVYDPSLPEEWRTWMRRKLITHTQSPTELS